MHHTGRHATICTASWAGSSRSDRGENGPNRLHEARNIAPLFAFKESAGFQRSEIFLHHAFVFWIAGSIEQRPTVFGASWVEVVGPTATKVKQACRFISWYWSTTAWGVMPCVSRTGDGRPVFI